MNLQTTFFRFTNKDNASLAEGEKGAVFTTASYALLFSSLAFMLLGAGFSGNIANGIGFPAHSISVLMLVLIIIMVLAVLAAGMGVFLLDTALGRLDFAGWAGVESLPYWLSLDVTGGGLLSALVLAVLSATLAGVLPALRITGRDVSDTIRKANAGRSGIRFGGAIGALVVADVAVSVVVVSLALSTVDRMTDAARAAQAAGIPADEYLAVDVRMPDASPRGGEAVERQRFREEMAAVQRALVERLQNEPGVRSVAVADALPRMDARSRPVEIDGVTRPGSMPGWYVSAVRIDPGFFSALPLPFCRVAWTSVGLPPVRMTVCSKGA